MTDTMHTHTHEPQPAVNDDLTVPPEIVIDMLRNEVAQLNDQRIMLISQVEMLKNVVGSLRQHIQSTKTDGSSEPVPDIE